MTPHRRESRAVVAVLGVVLISLAALLTGCGHHQAADDTGAKVDTSLTEQIARERITHYLTETLQGQPASVRLALKPDSEQLATFDPGFAVPCDDNDQTGDGPHEIQIRYWLVGIPDGQNARTFESVRDSWTRRGYRLQSDADSEWAPVRTPDGYGLVVQYVPEKDHSVSITAGSPCIPKSALGTTTPQPTEIK